MIYRFCSLCSAELAENKEGNLGCTRCSFVNYRNPRPTATALVLHNNKLLLTKRAREPFKNWWDLPGGFLHRNETPDVGALRELKEETGLDIKIIKQFGIYTGTYPSDTEPFDIISIVYVAESPTANLGAYDDVCESRWFSKQEIPSEIAFDSNQTIIKNFLKVWN